jgi:type VI protein secretion system component Hcp
MPHEAYVGITGKNQGAFKGESPRKADAGQWMEVVAFSTDLESPRDVSTGQASEERPYKIALCGCALPAGSPILGKSLRFVKAWGAASPQILTARATNEVLTDVAFQFIKTNQSGQRSVFQIVTLTNAMVSVVFRFVGDPESS